MQQKPSSIPLLFHRYLAILLYACFFIVQFSANYNYPNQSHPLFSTNYFANNYNHFTAVAKADKSKDRKVNIRLNKRFAPASVLYCEAIFSIRNTAYTLIKREATIYVAPYLPALHLHIKVLRGPPLIVA
jgi:hypothetical protein